MSINIQSLSEIDNFQKITLTDFSYSRIDTYNTCPSKYFYSYIQKEPRSFAEAATLGNIVHAVLETHVSAEKVLDQTELQNSFQKELLSFDPDKKINQELVSVGKQILNEFYDENIESTFDVLHKEYGFQFVIGNYLISGYIDRVDSMGENGIKIIDYKTGKWEVSPKDIPKNLQLGIYVLAMSTVYPDKDIYAELHYLRSRKKKGSLFLQRGYRGN